jgi:NTP pyrophosphatase (non-canonical NTP hydrolase)
MDYNVPSLTNVAREKLADEMESDLREMKEELADVINYCLLMADKLGVDPKQIVLDKMEKTAKKYPVEKAKGKSTKYNKL